MALEPSKNFFAQVLDFNWHKQSKSPNWNEVEFSAQDVLAI